MRAGLRHAEQHAGAAGEGQARGRQRHHHQARGVQQAPSDQHPEGAEAVGQHAGERAGDAPGQVLHRQREGEGLARPAAVHRDRLQPQAEAVADAHRQRDDGGAAEQHLGHRQPRGVRGDVHAGDSRGTRGCASPVRGWLTSRPQRTGGRRMKVLVLGSGVIGTDGGVLPGACRARGRGRRPPERPGAGDELRQCRRGLTGLLARPGPGPACRSRPSSGC